MGTIIRNLALLAVATLGVFSCQKDDDSSPEETWAIGTVQNPYKITSADDLRQLATDVNGGEDFEGEFFKVTTDIYLGGDSSEFTAIGTDDNPFNGTFDGGDKSVLELYINQSSYDDQGLFGCVGSQGVVKNLSVSGYVKGKNCVGGIAGNIYGVITDCGSSVEISGSSMIGGVVGYAYDNAIITNCYNTAKVRGSSSDAGGVVGYTANFVSVTNCYNTGEVTASNPYVGGVVGSNNGSDTKTVNCYNTGYVSGSTNFGGVVGCNTGSKIINCYNVGVVSGDYGYRGGVVGGNVSGGTITNCYWASNVTSAPSGAVGNGVGTAESMELANMKLDGFVTTLNNDAYSYNQDSPAVAACAWSTDSQSENSGYPLLNFNGTPTATE